MYLVGAYESRIYLEFHLFFVLFEVKAVFPKGDSSSKLDSSDDNLSSATTAENSPPYSPNTEPNDEVGGDFFPLYPIKGNLFQETKSDLDSNSSSSPVSFGSVKRPGIQANMVFSPPELKKNKTLLKDSTAQFTVSIGYSEMQTGAPFLATLEKVMDTFGDVELMVDDSLQWRTLRLKYPDLSEEELIEMAIKAGDEWLADNEIDKLVKKYDSRLTVRRWKDLPQRKLDEATEKMREYYKRYNWLCGLGSVSEHLQLMPVPSDSNQSPDFPKLYYSREPQENFVYFEHRNGKLYYLISLFAKKDKDKNILVEEPLSFEVDEDLMEEVFPLASRVGHPLFEPRSTLGWDALSDYTGQLRRLANPVRMAIDFTAKEFLRKRKQQPNAVRMNDEEALKEIKEYLFTECGAMLDEQLWRRSHFEVYLGLRSTAMKMVHDILMPKGKMHILDAVRVEIRGHKKEVENLLTKDQKKELKELNDSNKSKAIKRIENSVAALLNLSQQRANIQASSATGDVVVVALELGTEKQGPSYVAKR